SVLDVADGVLGARLAVARKDAPAAIVLLRKAVQAEDALHYGEPPDWFLHVRETLGGVLLLIGEVAEAEKVFRADLERNRRNGRPLCGGGASPGPKKRGAGAGWGQVEFQGAGAKAAPPLLKAEDL